jgi:hypothetical protein
MRSAGPSWRLDALTVNVDEWPFEEYSDGRLREEYRILFPCYAFREWISHVNEVNLHWNSLEWRKFEETTPNQYRRQQKVNTSSSMFSLHVTGRSILLLNGALASFIQNSSKDTPSKKEVREFGTCWWWKSCAIVRGIWGRHNFVRHWCPFAEFLVVIILKRSIELSHFIDIFGMMIERLSS